jgi:outer membrane autotransporter protein
VTGTTAGVKNNSVTVTFAGGSNSANASLTVGAAASGIPTASQNLQALEVAATKFVATASGDAITGAIDTAISDAFSPGGAPITAGANGLTINFAAEPQPNARTQEAFDALSYAATGYTKAPPPQPLFDRVWSAWADVRGTGFDQHDAFGEHGSQLNVTAGVGRKLTPDLLIGVFGGYENFLFTMASISGRITGEGETVGGYAAWRLADHWRVDGKFGWSDVSYNGTAASTVGAGTASGSFTGSRWLGAGGFTGTYRLAGYALEPSAQIYTLWERDSAFTDTLGTAQAARSFSESRVATGAKVLYPWQVASNVILSPYVGAYSDFRFSTDSTLPVGVPFVGLKDGWSARVTSGLAFTFRNSATVSLGAELGGLGAGYDIWSAKARVNWPF